jgi:flagellar hook-basal body complex protein FliE
MNASSALRSLAYPALRAEPPVQTLADAASPKAIPFTELEKLSPGILPQPLDRSQPAGGSFENTIKSFVSEVSQKQAVAGEAVQGLISGQNVSLHQTMIAMEEASISFQLMVEVRNKLLESYQELMRMQV